MYRTQIAVQSVIGFSGTVQDGMNLHPNNQELIYPVGSSVIIKNVATGKQSFQKEHQHRISALKISPNGKYIVTGETSELGLQAIVIVWDFFEKKLKHKLKLHKTSVSCIDFSRNQFYLATQGGREDKNMLIIWDLQNGKTLYGTPNKRQVRQIKYYNEKDTHLLSVTDTEVQIQHVDKVNKKIVTVEIEFGNVKRTFTCCDIDKRDVFAYVGTESGDFFEIYLEKGQVKRPGPAKKLFALGITNIKLVPETDDIIIGTGDGTISRVSLKNMEIKSRGEVMGAITSMCFTYDFSYFLCATDQSNIFMVNSKTLTTQLKSTSHYSKINDIAFPHNYSDVFATCAANEIRVWNTINQKELLRIQIPSLECSVVGFTPDGKSIVSGWADGRIRAFLPQSGKLMYLINDAHLKGVTALAFFNNQSTKIISGGTWGQVRIWKIEKNSRYLLASLKQHCGRVSSIQLTKNNEQAMSCSADGSCAIWDMRTYDKIASYQQPNSPLHQAVMHPKQFEFITVSTDGNLIYRQKFDVQLLRKIVACVKQSPQKKRNIEKQMFETLEKERQQAKQKNLTQKQKEKKEKKEKEKTNFMGVNTIAFINEGHNFFTGGGDKLLKLWEFDAGREKANGIGHSGIILKIKVSPDEKTVISVSDDGEIFFWDIPVELLRDLDELALSLSKPLGRGISQRSDKP